MKKAALRIITILTVLAVVIVPMCQVTTASAATATRYARYYLFGSKNSTYGLYNCDTGTKSDAITFISTCKNIGFSIEGGRKDWFSVSGKQLGTTVNSAGKTAYKYQINPTFKDNNGLNNRKVRVNIFDMTKGQANAVLLGYFDFEQVGKPVVKQLTLKSNRSIRVDITGCQRVSGYIMGMNFNNGACKVLAKKAYGMANSSGSKTLYINSSNPMNKGKYGVTIRPYAHLACGKDVNGPWRTWKYITVK